MKVEDVAWVAIHPAIGFARVGDSPDEVFYAPEVPGSPRPDGGYKDSSGRLKRQGVRFRIYAYSSDGTPIGEVTADNAEIDWRIHIANKKAAWFQFDTALDIPEAKTTRLRNCGVRDRSSLIIDPGPASISGASQPACDLTGAFLGEPVYLGSASTDSAGRLLFVGGHGVSRSLPPGNKPSTFANNDGWYDDISDGPVNATVRIAGREVPCKPAWVATAPPNYAPEILAVTTLYDLLIDGAIGGWLPTPTTTDFAADVYPIFDRLSQGQWVNEGFLQLFGAGGMNDLLRPGLLSRLSQPPSADGPDVNAEIRRVIFNQFRSPKFDDMQRLAWPPIYGDAVNFPADNPRQWYTITQTQYNHLSRWASGSFSGGLPSTQPGPTRLEEVALKKQPETLDRTSLDLCLGGPFHPGCELTWPVRHPSMFAEPLRVRHRDPRLPEPNYGETLTPAEAVGAEGPLYGQAPGDLTRWMAVPWQTDTSSCRDGYDTSYDQFLPTFWPARVPNQVLSEDNYKRILSSDDPSERWQAFLTRDDWLAPLGEDLGYLYQIDNMISRFGELSVVERRPGPVGDPRIPETLYVGSTPGSDDDPSQALASARKARRVSRTGLMAKYAQKRRDS